jgi:tRNA threonylcarbamoyladenosine biosynthesis protein TsaE
MNLNLADMTISKSTIKLVSHSPDKTEKFGREMAQRLNPGAVVAFYGDLGSGKTTLIRGLVRGLGAEKSTRVTSPTFVLMNMYQGRCPIYHFDFYRLSEPSMIADLGCEEYFGGEGVALIEWADRAGELVPGESIRIELTAIDETTREIQVVFPESMTGD